MGSFLPPSMSRTTSFALGARKRKVTLWSGCTSGDTIGCGRCARTEIQAVNKRRAMRFIAGEYTPPAELFRRPLEYQRERPRSLGPLASQRTLFQLAGEGAVNALE